MPVFLSAALAFAAPRTFRDLDATAVRIFLNEDRGTRDGKSAPDRLLVGGRDGRIHLINPANGSVDFTRGGGSSPVADVAYNARTAFWVERGSAVLRWEATAGYPGELDLTDRLGGPVRRLEVFRNYVVAQSASTTVFAEITGGKATGKVLRASEILDTKVAEAVDQGPARFFGDGSVYTFRRIARTESPREEGGSRDLCLIEGWRVSGKRAARLGGTVQAIGDFEDAPGARVRYRQSGERTYDLPHGWSDLRNVAVGKIGLVAVTKRRAVIVPFAQSGWLDSAEIPLPFDANYPAGVSYRQNDVWWPQGDRMMHVAFEATGNDTDRWAVSADVVRGRREVAFENAAVDEAGRVWATTNGRGVRIDPDDDEALRASGLTAYEAISSDAMDTIEQRKLRRILPDGPTDLNAILLGAGLAKDAGAARKRLASARPVVGIEFGDLVESGGRRGIYVGGGVVRLLGGDGSFELEPGMAARRFLLPDPAPVRWTPPTPVYGGGGVPDWGTQNTLPFLYPLARSRESSDLRYHRPFSPLHQALWAEMQTWSGTPYAWGGQSRSGVDCSGFVGAVYRTIGIRLPRVSSAIGRCRLGRPIPYSSGLRWGDVLWFPGRVGQSHVAIYIGNGRLMESGGRGSGVGIRPIYSRRAAVAMRFLNGG